jgi:hypothetical protein
VIDSDEWTAQELETIIRWEYLRNYLAIFRSPYLIGRRYYKFFRYRPTFIKFVLSRTWRAIRLKMIKGNARKEPQQY